MPKYQYYNNLVNLCDLSINNTNKNIIQTGGTNYVNVTIIYQQIDEEKRKYNKFYLVKDDFTAYEMHRVNINSQYIITIKVPVDQYFKFKFMRDNKIEILDEDIELKTVFDANHTLIPKDDDKDNAEFKDLNEWNARWRWIKPKENESDYIYYFSYYLPFYSIPLVADRATNSLIKNDHNPIEYDYLPDDPKIAPRKIKILDTHGNISSTIDLLEVTIVKDINKLKTTLLSQNLSYVGNEGNYDTLIDKVVRNTNMILYFQNFIKNNVELVTTQYDQLIKLIEHITTKLVSSNINDTYPGVTSKLDFTPPLPITLLYTNWSTLYYIFDTSTPGLDSFKKYTFYSDGKKYEFESSIHLIHDVKLEMIMLRISFVFTNLLRVTAQCFNNLPKKILEYVEFFKNFQSSNKNYAIKCLYLYLLQNSAPPLTSNIKNLKIDDTDQLTFVLPGITTTPIDYYEMDIYTSTEDDAKKIVAKIDKKYLLTHEWIQENLIGIKSIIETLHNTIKKNIKIASGDNTFYGYLFQLYQISLKKNPGDDQIALTNENTLTVNTVDYKSNVVKNVNLNPIVTPSNIYKTKLSHTDIIKFKKYEIISEVMRLMEFEIKLFGNSFWLELGDITFDNFIDGLSKINKIKLYYKFAYIHAYITSTHFSEQVTVLDDKIQIKTPAGNLEGDKIIKDRPTINLYRLINYNETLNKLYNLARYYIIRGELTIDTEPIDLIETGKKLSMDYLSTKDVFSDNTKYKSDIKLKTSNLLSDVELVTMLQIMLYAVDSYVDPGSDEILEPFKEIVDILYEDRKNRDDIIDIIRSAELLY